MQISETGVVIASVSRRHVMKYLAGDALAAAIIGVLVNVFRDTFCFQRVQRSNSKLRNSEAASGINK